MALTRNDLKALLDAFVKIIDQNTDYICTIGEPRNGPEEPCFVVMAGPDWYPTDITLGEASEIREFTYRAFSYPVDHPKEISEEEVSFMISTAFSAIVSNGISAIEKFAREFLTNIGVSNDDNIFTKGVVREIVLANVRAEFKYMEINHVMYRIGDIMIPIYLNDTIDFRSS